MDILKVHQLESHPKFSDYIDEIMSLLGDCSPEDYVCISVEGDSINVRVPKKTKLILEGTYHLPSLYCVDKKGKERVWTVWVDGATVHGVQGEVDGVKTPFERTYRGVNKGKINETTAEEQAIKEANRDWVKQLDKGYKPKDKEGINLLKNVNEAKAAQGGVNTGVADIINKKSKSQPKKSTDNLTIPGYVSDVLPMHCQGWSLENKVLKYFDFDNGVYIQPKLDGVRCIAKLIDDKIGLFSRTGKQFVWLQHIREEISEFLGEFPDVILDGEMYIEDSEYNGSNISEKFDMISGAVRPVRKEPHPEENQLSYHVFDVVDLKKDQDDRFLLLKEMFKKNKGKCPHIKLVKPVVVTYYEEVEDWHDTFAQDGYEGVVIRARDLMYESDTRSLKMRKYKHFVDEEYKILDVSLDPGVAKEQFCWVCEKEFSDGTIKKFNVKPMGTREQKLDMLKNKKKYVGKLLTVKYQAIEGEGEKGIPRFPIGKGIRDYE